MATTGPKPQTERVRQMSVTGEMEQLKAQLSLEAALSADQTFSQVKRISLTLYGPISLGPSTCWLIHDGSHPVLSAYRRTRERTLIRFDPHHFSISPDATFQQIYDQIASPDVDPCLALHVGLLSATSLPGGCLRLIFAVAGFEDPIRFWSLVDSLLAELHGLGFHSATPACAPSSAAAPVDQAATVAGLGSPPQPEPWLQIPDRRSDRRILELWWQGLTMPQIADRVGYSKKTVRNRLWKLRAEHGSAIVPTGRQLRQPGTK